MWLLALAGGLARARDAPGLQVRVAVAAGREPGETQASEKKLLEDRLERAQRAAQGLQEQLDKALEDAAALRAAIRAAVEASEGELPSAALAVADVVPWYGAPCLLDLLYGLSGVQAGVLPGLGAGVLVPVHAYAPLGEALAALEQGLAERRVLFSDTALNACIANLPSLETELNLEATLASERAYLPEYVTASRSAQFLGLFPPASTTTREEFAARGLTATSTAAATMRRVNRLPFVEDWLRRAEDPWTTSSLTSAAQMLHLVLKTLPEQVHKADYERRAERGLPPWQPLRMLDAGCGTGFIAVALALFLATQARGGAVACLEFMDWVHLRGKRLYALPHLLEPEVRGLVQDAGKWQYLSGAQWQDLGQEAQEQIQRLLSQPDGAQGTPVLPCSVVGGSDELGIVVDLARMEARSTGPCVGGPWPVLAPVPVQYLRGDALQMRFDGPLGPLHEPVPAQDLVIFGVAVNFGPALEAASGSQLEVWERTVAPGGILVAPFCDFEPYRTGPDEDGDAYCVGHWRAFQHLDNRHAEALEAPGASLRRSGAKASFVEVPLPYAIPARFIVPFCCHEEVALLENATASACAASPCDARTRQSFARTRSYERGLP